MSTLKVLVNPPFERLKEFIMSFKLGDRGGGRCGRWWVAVGMGCLRSQEHSLPVIHSE